MADVKIEVAIGRLFSTPEGKALKGELEYYATIPLHDVESSHNTAYLVGKRDLALYLLSMSEKSENDT